MIETLQKEEFNDRNELKKQLKSLIIPLGFNIYIKEGEKTSVDGLKLTLFGCNDNSKKLDQYKSSCPFFLLFKTNAEGKYKLAEYKNQHNHSLNDNKNKKKMNTPVKNYVEKNMNNFKSLSKMSTQINKDFGLSTKYHQIYYMQSKILKEKFGNPSEDAI